MHSIPIIHSFRKVSTTTVLYNKDVEIDTDTQAKCSVIDNVLAIGRQS